MWSTKCDFMACVMRHYQKSCVIIKNHLKFQPFFPLLRPAVICVFTYAVRGLFFCQNMALITVWVWNPWNRRSIGEKMPLVMTSQGVKLIDKVSCHVRHVFFIDHKPSKSHLLHHQTILYKFQKENKKMRKNCLLKIGFHQFFFWLKKSVLKSIVNILW